MRPSLRSGHEAAESQRRRSPRRAAQRARRRALQQEQSGLEIAPFSNTHAEVSAPGVGVLSARSRGGLVAFDGTSMATPHVAGVAALWWQAATQRGLPATSRTVVSQVLAHAKTEGLAAGVDISDRGVGLVMAP